jgi:hypothetical protein
VGADVGFGFHNTSAEDSAATTVNEDLAEQIGGQLDRRTLVKGTA